MNKYFRYALPAILLFPAALLGSCSSDSTSDTPDLPSSDNVENTVVVYAVNRSSLSADFNDDFAEITKALGSVDMDKNRLLIYKTDSDTECGLYTAVKDGSGKITFLPVKSYRRDVTSTHPDRIGEVLGDALAQYPGSRYSLFFWGHGMSWTPFFSSHDIKDSQMTYGYGGEYNSTSGVSRETDYIDIDELAAAVPDGKFDLIWFDCCYMAGVEVVYQFRDKCDTFVAYPTEVWGEGMPYDRVLPYIMKSDPDITGAAETFFNYFNYTGDPVTVSVFDMTAIESVADAAKKVLALGNERPEKSSLVNYSRDLTYKYYDFSQYLKGTADIYGATEAVRNLDAALAGFVKYHAESDKNFSNRPWIRQDLSGISVHYYMGERNPLEDYYRSLDWYKRVY